MTTWRYVVLGVVVVAAIVGLIPIVRYVPNSRVHLAAYEGRVGDIRDAVLRRPESLNSLRSFELDKRRSTMTPLMWAVLGGHPNAVSVLVELGADVNTSDQFGRTALWLAVKNRDLVIVESLLRAGAEPNADTTFGSSPLVAAIRQGDSATIRLLLAMGGNPRSKVANSTALFEAVVHGKVDMLRLLLDHPGVRPLAAIEREELLRACEQHPEAQCAELKAIIVENHE